MEQTLFFVLGIALVVLALAVAAVGLRWESFPPNRTVFAGMVGLFAALVIATGAFAWMNAEDEQSETAAEHAAERAEAAEEAAAEESEEAAEVEGEPTTEAEVDGAQVFDDAGCSGCHTLAAAGSIAETGPNLDGALKGKSEAYIETAIVDPNQQIAKGFSPDIMPQDFGTTLDDEQLQALVQYLSESTQ